MAITKIWKVEYSLQGTIEYVENEKKTDAAYAQYSDSIENAIDYAMNPDKTDALVFVSSVNCSPETAVQDMERTKRRFSKEDGIVAFHAVQSFVPGETTPEQAHKIGLELAQQMWGDRFEVVVATHVDRKHLHNHFVLNSVSFADGKRYYDNKKSYYGMLRKTNDAICREYGLSVIGRDGTRESTKNYADWQDGYTMREQLKADLDRHILRAQSWHELKANLASEGFFINDNSAHKYVTILPPYGTKALRLKESMLGAAYTPDGIRERIAYHVLTGQTLEYALKVKRVKKQRTAYRVLGQFEAIRATAKLHGIAALYWRYMYVLGKAGQKRAQLSPAARCEVTRQLRRFKQIKTRENFLRSHQICTATQLAEFDTKAQDKLRVLTDARQVLYNKRYGDKTVRHEKITALTQQIMQLRSDMKQCNAIASEQHTIDRNASQWQNELYTTAHALPQKENQSQISALINGR